MDEHSWHERSRREEFGAPTHHYRSWERDVNTASAPPEPTAEKDRFWTSRLALVIYASTALSLLQMDVRFICVALLAVLAKACVLTAKWLAFIFESKELQEAIDISRGYLNLVWGHIAAFAGDTREPGRIRKKATAAVVFSFRELQIHVLTRYVQIRHNRWKHMRDESARHASEVVESAKRRVTDASEVVASARRHATDLLH